MRRVERGLEVAFPDIHLDRPFYADDEETPVATIFESADPPSDSETQEREEKTLVADCLNSLNDREREILRRYYGFDQCEPMTLEEIGSTFGLTRERIRQLRDLGL